jgi:hypothetical protein
MKRALFKLLVAANLALAVCLLLGMRHRENRNVPPATDNAAAATADSESNHVGASIPARPLTQPLKPRAPETPFAKVYSADPAKFAANLRAIHCPEQTVIDILTAEMHRRFRSQEQALRPTPADHVPYRWSASTTEPKLVDRRQQASAIAREESAMLREALGCLAPITMPIYAMTSSDQQFEQRLAASPSINSCLIRQAQDTYWASVQTLQQRTKGFWLPEDAAELQQLKAQYQQSLRNLWPEQ